MSAGNLSVRLNLFASDRGITLQNRRPKMTFLCPAQTAAAVAAALKRDEASGAAGPEQSGLAPQSQNDRTHLTDGIGGGDSGMAGMRWAADGVQ